MRATGKNIGTVEFFPWLCRALCLQVPQVRMLSDLTDGRRIQGRWDQDAYKKD